MLIKEIKFVLKKAEFKLRNLLAPTFLSLCASGFEIFSVILLIPVVNFIVKQDMSYLEKIPVLSSYTKHFQDKSILVGLIFLVIFTCVLLKVTFVYSSQLLAVYHIRKFTRNLKDQIFDTYLNYGKRFFDQNNQGRLYQVLVSQTQILGSQMFQVQYVTTKLVMLVAYVLMLFYINWKITVFTIPILLVLYFTLSWLIHKIKITSKDHSKIQIKLTEKISNTLSCMQLVKAYNHEEEESRLFKKTSNRVFQLEYSMGKKQNLIPPMQEIIVLFTVFILLAVMAKILQQNPDPDAIGKFLVYFFVLKRTSNMFGSLNEMKAIIALMSGPWDDIVQMLKTEERFIVHGGDKEFEGLHKEILFKDLVFNYSDEQAVLKGVTLKIKKGKMTALVGATGSGKTTIANLLMRYYECPKEAVFLDGVDLNEFTLPSLRSKIAIVSQDVQLFNDTIKANILYGIKRKVDDEEFNQVLKKARLYDFVMNTKNGVNTQVGDRGVQLSGGEKQRVSIARAMLKNAEIYILDEATSALDSNTEAMIQEAIDEMIKGKTTLVIAHRLSTVKKADLIVVLDKGTVIEEGEPSELIEQKGHFFNFLTMQKFRS